MYYVFFLVVSKYGQNGLRRISQKTEIHHCSVTNIFPAIVHAFESLVATTACRALCVFPLKTSSVHGQSQTGERNVGDRFKRVGDGGSHPPRSLTAQGSGVPA